MAEAHITVDVQLDAESVRRAVRKMQALFTAVCAESFFGEGWRFPPLQLTTGDKPHPCKVHLLGRSWRSEGCGWRCPTCGAEWTLTIVHKLYEEHRTPYGVHPRADCGPQLCSLLPPRPVMEWIRDEVGG